MRHLPLLLILFLTSLAACDKQPDNDELDGKWQLLEIFSTGADGGFTQLTDKRESKTFWSFQLGLLQIGSNDLHNGSTADTFARFTHSGDRLSVNEVYVHYRDRDSLVTDPSSTAFASVGIRGNTAQFLINRLTSSQLILTSATDSLVFYKVH